MPAVENWTCLELQPPDHANRWLPAWQPKQCRSSPWRGRLTLTRDTQFKRAAATAHLGKYMVAASLARSTISRGTAPSTCARPSSHTTPSDPGQEEHTAAQQDTVPHVHNRAVHSAVVALNPKPHLLHHRQVLQVLVGLEQRIACQAQHGSQL